MVKSCKQCGLSFEVTASDIEIMGRIAPVFGGKKIEIPHPTLCPDCRQKRRITYRNERNFYKRKCNLTGKEIVSVYRPDSKCNVYDQVEWWTDNWDPMKSGRDFDFSKPFFEQFDKLACEAPRPSIMNMGSENSIYTNHSGFNKNCYMTINSAYSEDLLYCSNYNLYSKNCVDCLAIQHCELCYFCVNTKNSFSSSYLYECETLNNCSFCFDCEACSDCFCCWNLRHKKYCIENKQYTKDEYEKKLAQIRPKTWKESVKFFEYFKEKMKTFAIHKLVFIEKCQDCSGDHILNAKNVRDSYYAFQSEDCAYCYDAGAMKNCLDNTEPWNGELNYEGQAEFDAYHTMFCVKVFESHDIFYCTYCWTSSDLFGCVGLRNKKYCIFNKQYSKEEYEKLVPKIIEHMGGTVRAHGASAQDERESGFASSSEAEPKNREWGEFFPSNLSPFAYNETIAQDYYPLSKEEVLKMGMKWLDEEKSTVSDGGYSVPENINDVSDDICNKTLVCEITKRPFRVVSQELAFYRKMGLPVPLRHPDRRFSERMELRNPRKFWKRACSKCGNEQLSTFSTDRIEKTYCEKCYLSTVY